jgi:hypothetical protein
MLLVTCAAIASADCANIALPTQRLDVLVEAQDPAWSGPLSCKAANNLGEWPFTAPGPVFLRASTSPLHVSCSLPAGAAAQESITSAGTVDATREGGRKGASAGAKVGIGAGAVLGVAAAPVMGPVFAVLLVVGGAMRGAEIGGFVGAASSGKTAAYPSPIVLHIKPAAPESASEPAHMK